MLDERLSLLLRSGCETDHGKLVKPLVISPETEIRRPLHGSGCSTTKREEVKIPMETKWLGNVIKQTTPERCVFATSVNDYPLAPGDYVEINQDPSPRILGLVEGMYGDS